MRATYWAGAVLSLATVVGCSSDLTRDIASPTLSVAENSSGPSASGHANFINPFGELVQRSFHARQMQDGTVEGSFVQHNAATGVMIAGDIDCLQIGPTPNQAAMSGPIREHSADPTQIGRTVIFRVGDNGEGSNDPPDMISPLSRPGVTGDCRTFVNPIFTPIESGNIQVKP